MLKLLRRQPQPMKDVPDRECPGRVVDELASLARACRRGEKGAEKTLLNAVGPGMLQMVRRVMGPRDPEAEDVVQESMLALLKALPGFRGESSVKHFACRIATLLALKTLRARSRHEGLWATEVDETGWEGIEPRDWVAASMRRQLVRALLDDLPEAQAEALVLHYLAGFEVEEVAASTQNPVETIRSRLRLAKAALRERVAADPTMAAFLEDS